MKSFRAIVFLLSAIIFLSLSANAFPAKIVSGEMFLGGTAYGTPDYQTYIRFSLLARNLAPRRDYRMNGLQVYSVYLNHPVQPSGDYDYRVVMPYGPQSLAINNQPIYPVWFEDCVWDIKSSAQTPQITPDSPQIITTSSPFTISGSSAFFGADNSFFRIKGSGTAELRFERIGTKYFFREAVYRFSENTEPQKDLELFYKNPITPRF